MGQYAKHFTCSVFFSIHNNPNGDGVETRKGLQTQPKVK